MKINFVKTLLSFTLCSAILMSVPSINTKATDESPKTNKISVLSLNVAGLPEGLSSSSPKENTLQMSKLLNDYDIVSVQEDFAYHNDLIKNDNHPYKTVHSGNVPIGDGLNFMSNYSLHNTIRCKWEKSHGFITDGADEMTPKGILYSSMEIQPGIYIDVYDLHTDAGSDEGSYEARRDNMNQLARLIDERSTGKAVIVIGDTNSRYTRCEDNFEEAVLNKCKLKDAWIELIRNGNIPNDGEALIDHSKPNGSSNEVVDKIWYRDGVNIKLYATKYSLLETEFTDKDGNQLSDHYPITATFNYSIDDNIKMSDTFGGSGGTGFSFINYANTNPNKISISSGDRVDSILFTYNNNAIKAGGNGGSIKELNLSKNEYVTSVEMSKSTKSLLGSNRISYIKFITNKGHILEGGTKGITTTFTAPNGYGISGLYGCADNEIDRIGAIYKRI